MISEQQSEQAGEEKQVNSSGIQAKEETLCLVDVCPNFKEKITIAPVLLDDYIVDRDRKIKIGRDGHKYLKEELFSRGGRVQFDMDKGMDTFDPRPSDEGLNQIEQYLTWKADQSGENNLKNVTKNADIVCWRGNVTKLAASPYEEGGPGYKFVVEKFNDTIFLMELETDERIAQKQGQSEWERKCEYWGFKFETFIFAEKGKEPTPDEPVSTWEEMCGVFATTFPASKTEKELKLFYIAEMDGLDSEEKHVEAKTNAYKLFNNAYFHKKAMKWWLQSKIVGIDDIVVGFRTNKGVIFKLEKVSIGSLRGKCPEWNGDVCLRAVQHVLNTVKDKYDELVKPGELMIIERKPNKKAVKFVTVPASFKQVLSQEFKQKFTTPPTGTKRKADDQVPEVSEKVKRPSDDG